MLDYEAGPFETFPLHVQRLNLCLEAYSYIYSSKLSIYWTNSEPFEMKIMECSICLLPIENRLVDLMCKHMFHAHCLKRHQQQSTTKKQCPYCRTRIRVGNMDTMSTGTSPLIEQVSFPCNESVVFHHKLMDRYCTSSTPWTFRPFKLDEVTKLKLVLMAYPIMP